MSDRVSNHVIEIRFKPNPNFLDYRGEIASKLLSKTFDNWQISNDRIDLNSNEDKGVSAFFSFRNFGVSCNHPATKESFERVAKKFIRSAWEHFPTNSITRMGIRSSYLMEKKSFKEAFDDYKNNFLKLSDKELAPFGGDLVDIGFHMNLLDGENYFNIMTGPMEKNQWTGMFGLNEDLFNAGMYLEIDYFRNEISPNITVRDLVNFLGEGLKKAELVIIQINNLTAKD